jgi:WD40 repeat protein
VCGAANIDWRNVPERFTPIYAVAVAAHGDFVAAGRGNRIHMYHAPSKRQNGTLADPALTDFLPAGSPAGAHLDFVQSLAFSPDGKRLVSGGYRVAKIWNRTATAAATLLGRVES